MHTKEEILSLLKKHNDKDPQIKELIELYIGKMDKDDLNDLYLILTSKNPEEIEKIKSQKQNEMYELYLKIQSLNVQSQKVILEFNENQSTQKDANDADNLIKKL